MKPLITRTPSRVIPAADRERPLALSFAQRGLWLLEQLDPGSAAYNVPFAVRVDGTLDTDALTAAVRRIVARHEALRTTIRLEAGEPVAHIAPGCELTVAVTDLAGVPAADRERRCDQLVHAWSHEPFHLASDSLIRVRLIRLGDDAHVLVVVMHHIVCDGQSIHILFDELAAEYAGAEGGPVPAVQYPDFAAWQRAQPRDEDEIAWWRTYLAGAPTVLELPTDRPRPAVRTSAGATHVFTLPRALADDTATMARRLRMSPFMVMLSAYSALVARLTGADEMLLGTPFSARSQPELEPLIGFFVNTLPVRVDVSGSPTFAQLLKRVRTSVLDVLAHQDTPFDTLVETLALDRSPSHTPLVQTVFTFDARPLAEPRLEGTTTELLTLRADSAKFDLDFMVVQSADGSGDLEVWINYSTDLYDGATIRRLAGRFERLLATAVADPDTPLHALPMLDADERDTVLGTWSTTAAARPSDVLVPELVALRAAATPDAPAVSLDADVLSYGELDERSDRLACQLQSLGIAPDDVVGILLPRGLELAIAVLGVMKSGAAYLPLDARHPSAHIGRVLATAASQLVITDALHAQRLDGTDADALRVDAPALVAGPAARPRPAARADNLAYVIFTSGSTGEPKGVGVPHRALANHAQAMRDRLALSANDRVLQFASITFDVAVEELFPTWLAGGCVVMCPDPPAPAALSDLLRRGRVTVANLPSSYWQQWVATLDLAQPVAASSLRLLVIGSESVDGETLARWHRCTSIETLNAYGLTETAVTAVVHHVAESEPTVTVPIGKPIDGVNAYVLDADLEPVAAGVEGELYLGGAGLARGYLTRPDLTAERFLPNPFATTLGARLHRTGDRARWRADGSLEVVGRMDEQLKVRGHRIEPAEVEAALCGHLEITQAAVVARDGRLVGYVVPRSGSKVPADLRDHLAGRLPTYLVPDTLVGVHALPLSASGKVNRKALPAPAPAAAPATAGRSSAPPTTGLERRIASIWTEVLGIDGVGIHDNFFDAGGSSFSLATVHARLGELIGRRIAMVTLYEYPTIAALAQHLAPAERPSGVHPAIPRSRDADPAAPSTSTSAAAERALRLRARRGRSAQKRLVTR